MLGLTRIAEKLTSGTAKIFMYHGICDDDEKIKCWWQLEKSKFENQICYIKIKKNILSIQQFLECLHSQGTIPANSAVITFDDGYKNYISNALPILKKYNVPSTMYIPTEPVSNGRLIWSDKLYENLFQLSATELDLSNAGLNKLPFGNVSQKARSIESVISFLKELRDEKRNEIIHAIYNCINIDKNLKSSEKSLFALMSSDHIRAISEDPLVTIGSHAVTHKPLTSIPDAQIVTELKESKSYLEAITGQKIEHFCYPAGFHSPEIAAAVKMVGYRSAVIVGGSHKKIKDAYHLPRIGIGSAETFSFFKCQTSGLISLKNRLLILLNGR